MGAAMTEDDLVIFEKQTMGKAPPLFIIFNKQNCPVKRRLGNDGAEDGVHRWIPDSSLGRTFDTTIFQAGSQHTQT